MAEETKRKKNLVDIGAVALASGLMAALVPESIRNIKEGNYAHGAADCLAFLAMGYVAYSQGKKIIYGK